MRTLKQLWLFMLTPPRWRVKKGDDEFAISVHRMVWLVGWIWVVAGLLLGALVAPSVTKGWRLDNTALQDPIDIGISVVLGFIVQLLGWVVLLPPTLILWKVLIGVRDRYKAGEISENKIEWFYAIMAGLPFLAMFIYLLPVAGVGYLIYLYATWVGPDRAATAVGFVGGFLIKAFVIPLMWGTVKSAAFQRLMDWLRGNTASKL